MEGSSGSCGNVSGRDRQAGGLGMPKPWSESNAMIASRVVDVHCLPIPQEYLTDQGVAV